MNESATPSVEPEHWLPVVGYEGLYEVSDLGRVKSLPRSGTPGGILKPSINTGHPYLKVGLTRDCMTRSPKVHILVARAFLGPCREGFEVCHGPGGPQDNRLANLSYGTHVKNMADQRRDGTLIAGVRAAGAMLDDEIVRECRVRAGAGETSAALAREFGVSRKTMWAVVAGKTWKHVA